MDLGADVGYRWFARAGKPTLFPFGYGLSYTRFAHSELEVSGGRTLEVRFTVTNTGSRAGIDTPQVYALVGGVPRLIGWSRVNLGPGESCQVRVIADMRLLANYDVTLPGWVVAAGSVEVRVATSAESIGLQGAASLSVQQIGP